MRQLIVQAAGLTPVCLVSRPRHLMQLLPSRRSRASAPAVVAALPQPSGGAETGGPAPLPTFPEPTKVGHSHVKLHGRVVRAPSSRRGGQNGVALAEFTINVAQGDGPAELVKVVATEQVAAQAMAYLRTHDEVVVDGAIRSEELPPAMGSPAPSYSTWISAQTLFRPAATNAYPRPPAYAPAAPAPAAPGPAATPSQKFGLPGPSPTPAAGGNNRAMRQQQEEANWQRFKANPSAFWDNRFNKRNPKAPDFKEKQGELALWLTNYYLPEWVPGFLTEWDEKRGA